MPWIQTDEGVLYEIPSNGVQIGRGDENDIVLDWKSVSKIHARIIPQDNIGVTEISEDELKSAEEMEGRRYFIEDCQSRNGTFISHELPDEDNPMVRVTGVQGLSQGDFLQFGSNRRYFRYFSQLPDDLREVKAIDLSKKGAISASSDKSSSEVLLLTENMSSKIPSNTLSMTPKVERRDLSIIDENEDLSAEIAIIPREISRLNTAKQGLHHDRDNNVRDTNAITVTYPTVGGMKNPVSIHIDATDKNPFFSSRDRDYGLHIQKDSKANTNTQVGTQAFDESVIQFLKTHHSDIVRSNESVNPDAPHAQFMDSNMPSESLFNMKQDTKKDRKSVV